MTKFIKTYKSFIFETEILHMPIGSLTKLSAFSVMLLYIKLCVKLDNNRSNSAEQYIPVNIDTTLNDYVDDLISTDKHKKGNDFLKNYLLNNIFVIGTRANISDDLKDTALNAKPYNYIYYSETGKANVLMSSSINFKPFVKDIMFKPTDFYIKPDIRRIGTIELEDFLYNSRIKIQPYLDNYWTRKVKENPSSIKQAEKEMSEEGLKKLKGVALGSKFGLFDD